MGSSGSSEPKNPPPTALELELRKQNAETWNRYLSTMRNFENEYLADLMVPTDAEKLTTTGMTNAMLASNPELQADPRQLSAGGARFAGNVHALGMARGNAGGRAMASAAGATDDRRLVQIGNAVAMGRGEGMAATSTLSELAGREAGYANALTVDRFRTRTDNSSSRNAAIGTAAGIGLRSIMGTDKEKEVA